MNKEIIKEIKEADFLSRVFAFKSDDEKDFFYMFEDKNDIKKYSSVKWLYSSYNRYAKLIGVTDHNFIFSIDDDFEQDILCVSFFDIPFLFFRLSVEVGKNHITTLAENNQYRADLEKYVEWCNKKGFKIEKRDIRLLQESILKSDNK